VLAVVESAKVPWGLAVATGNTLQIQLLGELGVARGGERLRLPQSKKTRALLGYLALTGRAYPRDQLCDLLWDVADDPRGALRWSLSKLRPLVDDDDATRIVADRETVRFAAAGARIDAIELRGALRDGPGALDTERLRGLVDGHRGALLEGLDLPDFHTFQAWCVGEREQLRDLYARALRELVSRLVAEPAAALAHAQRLAGLDPADEEARAILVRLLARLGRRTEAERHVEDCQRQMRELGVAPSGALAAAWFEARSAPRAGTAPPVVAPRSPTAPTPASADGEPPLVGRRAELAQLVAALDRVGAGRTVVVSLTGEPGVGKTRLLGALLAQVPGRGGSVVAGRAHEPESGRPYGAWIDALRRAAGGGPAPDLSGASATRSREQLFASVQAFLAGLAAPVAIAFDDVQWLDEASAELLHYVARTACAGAAGPPLLVAVAARSGEIMDNGPMLRVLRGLRRECTFEELAIGPLDEVDTAALVAPIAPDAAGVFAGSAGNPLFALELARAGRRADDALPATLTGLVRERIERLSTDAVDVLRWSAALGRRAEVAALAALTALSTEGLMGALELLERHTLLCAAAGGYVFAHDVVRQVVYADLSEPRRRLMHRRIAEALSVRGDEGGEAIADLARHASLAGDAAMAARACVDAGRRSLQVFASAEALQLARRGTHYAEQLPEPDRTRFLIDLWNVRLSAAYPDDPRGVAATLEALAERALDHGCLGPARLGFHLVAYLRWGVGLASDAARTMRHAEQVSRGTEGRDRVVALAEAAVCLGRLERDLGDAEALALEARAIATRAGLEVAALPMAFGLLRAHRGELDQAARDYRDAWAIAHRARDRLDEFAALEQLVMLALRRGRLEEARADAAELLGLGDRLRDGSDGPCARALAATVSYAGGPAPADVDADAALAELRGADAKQRLGFALLSVAEVDLERGRFAAARARAGEALELARVMSLPTDQAWARLVLARAAAGAGDEAAHRAEVAALGGSDLALVAAPIRAQVTAHLARHGGGRP